MALKKLGAAAVILNEHGHVLLVRHSYGPLNWEIPGGHAEADESMVETVLREVYEETGLRVRALYTTGTYYDPRSDMHHFVFMCALLDATAVPQPASDEITACGFWPPASLPRPISDFTVQRIGDALAGSQQPLPAVLQSWLWLDEA
jgi:8-oxo-dGTP pyrophosphatase MutT (NUDIX family)